MRISPALGYEYTAYLKNHWSHAKGHADVVAYFLLRSTELLRLHGCAGFITTNSIGEGDTREVGLQHILSIGFSLFRANKSMAWPGTAGVSISTIHLRKGDPFPVATLDGTQVGRVGSRLEEIAAEESGSHPHRLSANAGIVSKGTGLVGIGFVIERQEYEDLIAQDPRNAEVLFRYLNAEDFNQTVKTEPTRWVINFREWDKEIAATYRKPFDIVTSLVKPVRDKITKQIHEKNYWLFWDKRKDLYGRIEHVSEVLIAPVVTKYVNFAFVPSGWIYSNEVYVIPSESRSLFASLQSSLHAAWVLGTTSTLETRIRYTATDSFQTFPLPHLKCDGTLTSVGDRYHHERREIMGGLKVGLTKLYNFFHNKAELVGRIGLLRDLHVEMDNAVAAAYGWSDLDLGHGFHETKQGIRFTISEAARREVLARLLKLNHERYAEEVAQGLHNKKAKSTTTGKRRATKIHESQAMLFDQERPLR
jgi:hypothetical protein